MRVLLLAFALTIPLVACQVRDKAGPGKQLVTEDLTVTYPDGRTIEDRRFAASVPMDEGEVYHFDDMGRLFLYLSSNDPALARAVVYDYETREPLQSGEAFYVVSTTLVTPRGSGIIAFASEAMARDMARQLAGLVLPWAELVAYLEAAAELPLPPSGGAEGGGLMLPVR